MEASSINKLGAPELEVVQEYRKKNPKKFTMGKHSSAVPGRRLRSKDIGAGGGFTESMANTMPEGFSQANAFDTESCFLTTESGVEQAPAMGPASDM